MVTTPKQVQTMDKLVFLATQYADKTIQELSSLFAMSIFEINTAIWQAQDEGFLYVDKKTGLYKIEKTPEVWEFGIEVEEIMHTILYTFQKLAEEENDLGDHDLSKWASGWLNHDVAVAMKMLLEEHKLAEYEITDVMTLEPSKKGLKRGKEPKVIEDTYTFYSLYENAEQEWGRKQFKDASKLK